MRAAGLVLLLAAWPAAAENSGPRLVALGGVTALTGALGGQYNPGFVLGAEAGWIPGALGAVWWFKYQRYGTSDERNPVDSIKLFDLGMALRGRIRFWSPVPTYVYAQFGASLLRTSGPVEPEGTTNFAGPNLGVGIEVGLGTYVVAFGADYSLLVGGPSSLSAILRVGYGGGD